jgi:hypothetical protein
MPDAWRIPATGVGWRRSFSLPWVGYLIVALQLPIARFVIAAVIALTIAKSLLRKIWSPAEP